MSIGWFVILGFLIGILLKFSSRRRVQRETQLIERYLKDSQKRRLDQLYGRNHDE